MQQITILEPGSIEVVAGGIVGKVSHSTFYRVEGDSDCEGRGPRNVIGHFFRDTTAHEAAKGKGAMGNMGYVIPITGYIVTINHGTEAQSSFVLGARVEMNYEDPEDIRERALSKLTPEERRLLGVPEPRKR